MIGNIGSHFSQGQPTGPLTHLNHSAPGNSNYQRQPGQHPSFHNTNQGGNAVNATISSAVNNLAQNTAHLLNQTQFNSLQTNISSTNSSANGNNTQSNSGGNQTASVSNLNNLLLVQQLLNTSLPQLQNAANASPSNNSTEGGTSAGNGQGLQNLATLLQLAQKPSNLLNLPALLAAANQQQTPNSSQLSKSNSGSNTTGVNSSAIGNLNSTNNSSLSNSALTNINNNNFGKFYFRLG